METYKIITKWSTLEQFAKKYLGAHKDRMCFYHSPNETFIRSLDDKPLDLLRREFELVKCDFSVEDAIIDDAYNPYGYFGNQLLFK